MNDTTIIPEIILSNLTVSLIPAKGGTRDDGSSREGWREAWEGAGKPAMFYSIKGQATINDRRVLATVNVSACRDGQLCELGIEREGTSRMLSQYQPEHALQFTLEDGELVATEALPVFNNAFNDEECPVEYGVAFLILTDNRKALLLRDVEVIKAGASEKGTLYADIRAYGGYEITQAPNTGAHGPALTAGAGFTLPKGEIVRGAARNTRAATATAARKAAPETMVRSV